MRIYKRVAFAFVALILLSQYGTGRAQPPSSEPYLWRNVVIGGGGFVTGIIPHPRQKGLIYVRTDVGGAYRWDDSAKLWIPITDWIGIADANLMGIESVTVDPSDAKRVYLAAGTYSGGNAAILRSADQGRTWQRADVPFKMGGNEQGRFNGERLAVDPNQGDILFFGSRRDGLWRSADRGTTWLRVEGFTNIGSNPPPPVASVTTTNAAGQRRGRGGFGWNQPVGVIAVVFDAASGKPGSPTPRLYAAVSAVEANFYCSTNGGVAWEAVTNQPVGLRPNHLVPSPDGTFYLSYGRESGPNQMSDGAVWKFSPRDNVWTDITPVKPKDSDQPFGYGCVAVDAQHPATLMVTTFAHWKPHDEIYRSTNGGASWAQLWQTNTTVWDYSSAPYTRTGTPHWMGTIVINPFDSDQVLFTTGYGIWCCTNVTKADSGKPTHWVFLNKGLEETVPLTLISPPAGAHLLSGVGDIDGFCHDDLSISPAQGSFEGPHYGNTEDMAFAGLKPGVIVRTGTSRSGIVCAAVSINGGRTWETLGSEPTNNASAGAITISADGNTIVWAPRRCDPHYSVNRGTNWSACAGLSSDVRVVADPVDPARFYAYDAHVGRVLVSTNGAVAFAPTTAAFPPAADSGRGFGGADAALSATPGVKGDLWLAFRSSGLYHSTDTGATFTKLDAVQEAYSLGIGKAAPGKKNPALYLAGKVGNLQALFRSDDDGGNWVRISDDQHQYGWISHVTGDPRIYGRVYFGTGGRGIVYGDRVPNTR